MGTTYRLTIEAAKDRAAPCKWVRVAAFELGKAYELALDLDWIDPREELSPIARAERNATPEGARAAMLGYVFSRCPRCAGDLDGKAGAFVCRVCGQPCTRPGRYNAKGEPAPDDAAARELLDAAERARFELLEREPWRMGEPDPWGYDDDRPFRGVRDVASVIAFLERARELEGEPLELGPELVALSTLLAALERVSSSPWRVRCALWSDQ